MVVGQGLRQTPMKKTANPANAKKPVWFFIVLVVLIAWQRGHLPHPFKLLKPTNKVFILAN